MRNKKIQIHIKQPIQRDITAKDVQELPGYRIEYVLYQYEKTDEGGLDILTDQLKFRLSPPGTFAHSPYKQQKKLKDWKVQILNDGSMWVT
jgi:hypothetical protein